MLDNHIKNVHPGSDQDPVTHTCEYCGKPYGTKQALDLHRKRKHLQVGKMNIEADSDWIQYYCI